MNAKALLWKIPLGIVGGVSGLVVIVLVVAACVLYVPSLRTKVIHKGVVIANDKTDYDIDLGRIYLSPFHHSPMVLYRAYKGQADLPVEVEIDSLFVGHRGEDTLVYVHALRLRATAFTKGRTLPDSILSTPIVVDTLLLDQPTFHSGKLIKTVGVDVVVDRLQLSSPQVLISEGKYPLHGLQIIGADVGIDLRPDTTSKPKPKTEPKPLRLAFDLPDGELRDIHFRLTPLGLDIRTGSLSTNALVDVGGNTYDARRLNVGDFALSIGKLYLPMDTVYGNGRVELDKNLITSSELHARSESLGAKADLQTTAMNLKSMRVDVVGDAECQGSKARLRGYYDINDEAYDATVHIDTVDLSPFLKDSVKAILAGDIRAEGRGFNPRSRAMKSKVHMHLSDAVYEHINVSGLILDAELANQTVSGTLHLPVTMTDKKLPLRAQTEHQFTVADFMTPERMEVDYHTQMRNVRTKLGGETIKADRLTLDFATDSTTSADLRTNGLRLTAGTPMHVMTFVDRLQPFLQTISDTSVLHALTSLSDLTVLDTIRHRLPDVQTTIALDHGSPIQPFIDRTGLDIRQAHLSLASDSLRTDLALDASMPSIEHPGDSTALRLPPADASLKLAMTEGKTNASLLANTHVTDGAMGVYDLCTDAALNMDVWRDERELHGDGRLTLDSLSYGNAALGNHAIDMQLSPSRTYTNALRADVKLDDIPLDIVEGFVSLPDIAIRGAVRATASVDGLPRKADISAEVQPLGVAAAYKPYQIGIGLGETPIIMSHNHVDLNGLPVYGADSTFITLNGGLDLDSMQVDITLKGDSFAPVKLPQGGPIPVYGELATDIRGRVSGPLDAIVADVDVTLLPVTDITYPISKKNLAQVKPHGTVNVRYAMKDTLNGSPLALGGRINVDDGFVRYSPKAYPIMPFHVDSGSHVAFYGPLGKTQLHVSASQKVKADVESENEETRRVNFTTGVRVNGELDSIGLQSIGFFLEAPEDEAVTRELESVDEDTREGLAATLLATGMYVGESNVAAQREGYALSSIINSRINAAMANSKIGKVVDIDFSSGQSEHAQGKTNDMNISISKSFFKDKLRLTLGSSITDNPEINDAKGLFTNFTADYKLTKDGGVSLRLYSQRDYNNVLEGELYKSGLSVLATKEWQRKQLFRSDSIIRTYGITADAGVAYRSNNSIGPDVTLKSTIKNVLGKGETFTLKGNGAYYWALRNRHPGDPKKTDTYKLGVNASLVFPYLHWMGDNNPEGNTRYMLGYQYENIAGGYGVHKMYGSFTYFIHSSNSPYITHAFTPFSLSVVLMKAENDSSMIEKTSEFPDLIKVIAGNEFVPSIGYNFIYDNYRSKRAVNTALDLGVKESGNLINALYCLFGSKWNDKEKKLGSITFHQFVKLTAELRNKFNFTDQICIATRLYAGANIPLGNSLFAPLSEAFYTGGPLSLRAAAPYAYGPGNFNSPKYNQNFFHAGDVKLEANFEFRFPIVWKLFGAAFLDAGNVWSWYSLKEIFEAAGHPEYVNSLELPKGVTLYDGIINNPEFAKQIALGTGAGLRLDIDGLVVRLDFGIGIHAPFQTYKYDKDGKPNYDAPINTYYNIPSFLDGFRVNFGIGYPF